MDNFKIIYKILKALEAALDYEESDIDEISHEKLKITYTRWVNILIMLFENGYITGITVPIIGCSHCSYLGHLHRHGRYFRNLITFKSCHRVPIQRYKCPSCNKTCSIRPFFILPYFQYSFFVVFSILLQSLVLKYFYRLIIFNSLATNPFILQCAKDLAFPLHKTRYGCSPKFRMLLLPITTANTSLR